MPSELKRVKDVFAEAVELNGSARRAFLDQACAGDTMFRAEVEDYLAASESAGDGLSSPTAGQLAAGIISELSEGAGGTIGPYKLLQLIGEGGFGSVFMAEQEKPVRRRVALKIIKLGMDTRQVIARFEAERQALAMMDHPNIARVLEAGATGSGRPFFVMELVRGIPITEYCDVNRLSTSQRLELFIPICHAIQHAHQKGVIHRDIKPSNVLVTLHDGTPVPKVIDFGVAKATNSRLTEKTLFTEFRQMIGTPAYMSPEQAEMSGLDIDTRSDIYSLGVLLYELLTGTTPFDPEKLRSAAYDEVQRIIREVDPPRPSTRLSTAGMPLEKLAASRNVDAGRLRQLVRGDLDWIVMKALEKDRTRRYATANEFAHDIRRHLNDEAIEACPPSPIYRVRRFIRRHQVAVITVLTFALLTATAVALYISAISTEQRKTADALVDAQDQRGKADGRRNQALQATIRAREAEALANRELVRAAISQGRGAAESTRSGRRFDSLELLAAAAKISPTAEVRSQAIRCMGLPDMRITQEWSGSDDATCFNHACTFYADCTAAGEVLIRAIPEVGSPPAAPLGRLPGRAVNGRVAFSPDDQFVGAGYAEGHVRIFKLDGKPVLDIAEGPTFDFAPDGLSIAVRKRNGPVIIYDLPSGTEQRRLPWPSASALAFSPDGRKLAMLDIASPTDVVVGEFSTGFIARLTHPGRVIRIGWNPAGTMLATASESADGKGISLWDLTVKASETARSPEKILAGHQGVFDVKFSHGGDLLVSASSDGTARMWDVVTGEHLVKLFCTGAVQFSGDDRMLAFAADRGRHALAEVAAGRERRILAAPRAKVERQVAFSPDGVLMASPGDTAVRFWNVSVPGFPASPIDLLMRSPASSIVFHPDGASALVSSIWDLWRVPLISRWSPARERDKAPTQRVEIGPKEELFPMETHADGPVQLSADGLHLALAAKNQDVIVFDLRRPAEPVTIAGSTRATFMSFSPDGQWIATGTSNGASDKRVAVWDARTGKLLRALPVPLDASVAFSPDSQWLVTASAAEFRFWEAGTWQPKYALPINTERVGRVVFSADSKMVALSTQHSGVRLIDADTKAELATLEDDGDERPLAFSSDASLLATMGRGDTIRLWDLRRVREQLKKMGLDWSAPPLPPPGAPHRVDAVIMPPKPAL